MHSKEKLFHIKAYMKKQLIEELNLASSYEFDKIVKPHAERSGNEWGTITRPNKYVSSLTWFRHIKCKGKKPMIRGRVLVTNGLKCIALNSIMFQCPLIVGSRFCP